MVRTVLTKVSADLTKVSTFPTKVRKTFTKVRKVLSKVRRSLPNAFMLFSLKTRVGGSVESGVGRGDWRGRGGKWLGKGILRGKRVGNENGLIRDWIVLLV